MNRREFLVNSSAAIAMAGTASLAQPANNSITANGITIDAYCTLGVDREYTLTETQLLAAMDKAGVNKAIIAPPDRFLAVYNHQGNEDMKRTAKSHPHRFMPSCSVNPWFGKTAVEELKRALGEGARMLVVHPAVQGFLANDELLFPIIEEADQARVPIYIHTGQPGNSTPWQTVDLAGKYPQSDFILGHCGATDFWNDMPGAVTALPNVYCEASLSRPFRFAEYVKTVGSRKCVMGSWAPLSDLVFEWEEMRKYLPQKDQPDCLGNSMYALLQKRGPL